MASGSSADDIVPVVDTLCCGGIFMCARSFVSHRSRQYAFQYGINIVILVSSILQVQL